MSKFKVGDRVRIVQETYGHEFNIGDVVEITKVTETDYQARSKDDYWWILDCEAELVSKASKFTIGQTYKTAGDHTVTCIALREDGGMFGVFGTDRTSAYSWDGEGNYLCAVSSECPPYRIVFEPVVEWVHEDRELYGIHLNIAFPVVDGVPDWSRAVVTPCT